MAMYFYILIKELFSVPKTFIAVDSTQSDGIMIYESWSVPYASSAWFPPPSMIIYFSFFTSHAERSFEKRKEQFLVI